MLPTGVGEQDAQKGSLEMTETLVERATFLVDAKGVIRQIWRKVKVPGHVEAVLAAAKAL